MSVPEQVRFQGRVYKLATKKTVADPAVEKVRKKIDQRKHYQNMVTKNFDYAATVNQFMESGSLPGVIKDEIRALLSPSLTPKIRRKVVERHLKKIVDRMKETARPLLVEMLIELALEEMRRGKQQVLKGRPGFDGPAEQENS
jgi:hypothetical protein